MHLLRVSLRNLQPSQPYVSAEKLSRVMWQFARHELDTQEAVSLWRLGDRLVITDGHTRALAAWLMGRDRIIARWETDPLDWEAYRICVRWCEESGIRSVPDLTGRVLNTADFRGLWLDRCLQMQSQLHKERTKRRKVSESAVTYRQPVAPQSHPTPEATETSAPSSSAPTPQQTAAAAPDAANMTRPLAKTPAASVNRPAPVASQPSVKARGSSSPPAAVTPGNAAITQAMLDDEMTMPLVGLPPGIANGIEATPAAVTQIEEAAGNDVQPDDARLDGAQSGGTQSNDSPPNHSQANRAFLSHLRSTNPTPPRSSLGRKRFEDGDMTLPLQDMSLEGRSSVQPTPKSSQPLSNRQRQGRRGRSEAASSVKAAQPSASQQNKTDSSPAAIEPTRTTTAINWDYEDQTIIDMPQTHIDVPQTQINPTDSDEPSATDAPSTSTPTQSQS
ncbi:hypothetical protein [Vacuolonema iberomarrocanum]|uniref:hypothetical protein n=1 Tax=Vacuolonema iberomarrocanum TaxID=3454632 RepID=UPI0019E3F54E|nr:hypothetical protein [filamentous cyanobacterium LEGE 07170]